MLSSPNDESPANVEAAVSIDVLLDSSCFNFGRPFILLCNVSLPSCSMAFSSLEVLPNSAIESFTSLMIGN